MARRIRYRVIAHTADYAFEARAADFPALVRTCILACSDAMFGLDALHGTEEVEFAVASEDREMAVFQALSEVLYLFETRGLIPCDADVVESADRGLVVRMRCDRYDPARHRHRVAFKAATLHGLRVKAHARGLSVRVVMDT